MKREHRIIRVKKQIKDADNGADFVSRLLMRDKVHDAIMALLPVAVLVTLALMIYYGP